MQVQYRIERFGNKLPKLIVLLALATVIFAQEPSQQPWGIADSNFDTLSAADSTAGAPSFLWNENSIREPGPQADMPFQPNSVDNSPARSNDNIYTWQPQPSPDQWPSHLPDPHLAAGDYTQRNVDDTANGYNIISQTDNQAPNFLNQVEEFTIQYLRKYPADAFNSTNVIIAIFTQLNNEIQNCYECQQLIVQRQFLNKVEALCQQFQRLYPDINQPFLSEQITIDEDIARLIKYRLANEHLNAANVTVNKRKWRQVIERDCRIFVAIELGKKYPAGSEPKWHSIFKREFDAQFQRFNEARATWQTESGGNQQK